MSLEKIIQKSIASFIKQKKFNSFEEMIISSVQSILESETLTIIAAHLGLVRRFDEWEIHDKYDKPTEFAKFIREKCKTNVEAWFQQFEKGIPNPTLGMIKAFTKEYKEAFMEEALYLIGQKAKEDVQVFIESKCEEIKDKVVENLEKRFQGV